MYGRPHYIYIVNLIAYEFAREQQTDTFVSIVIAFTFVNMSKIASLSAPWRITDSNRWPPACKAGALASWANPPYP